VIEIVPVIFLQPHILWEAYGINLGTKHPSPPAQPSSKKFYIDVRVHHEDPSEGIPIPSTHIQAFFMHTSHDPPASMEEHLLISMAPLP
jgi:hypothetical protein